MILNRQRRVPVCTKTLGEFFQRARCELRFPENGVTVSLISDSAMTELNRVFRGKNKPTDVLSFPAEPLPPRRPGARRSATSTAGGTAARAAARKRVAAPVQAAPEEYVGDIAISPETARRNARQSSRALMAELRILILHGMIHLAGYDHETDEGQMEKLERQLRRRLGLKA